MRYREDSTEAQACARQAVAAWREQHPDDTAEEMLAAIGGDFHPDYGPVLRACLFRQQLRDPQVAAGVTIATREKQ